MYERSVCSTVVSGGVLVRTSTTLLVPYCKRQVPCEATSVSLTDLLYVESTYLLEINVSRVFFPSYVCRKRNLKKKNSSLESRVFFEVMYQKYFVKLNLVFSRVFFNL
jgi:hypothetical protein